MNSTLCVRWLASSEVISQVLFTSKQPKKNKMALVDILPQIKLSTLWAASYSACVVYTITIIHLNVGESGGYLPPLRWILFKFKISMGTFSPPPGLNRIKRKPVKVLERALQMINLINFSLEDIITCTILGMFITLIPCPHQSLNMFKSCLVKHGLKLFCL